MSTERFRILATAVFNLLVWTLFFKLAVPRLVLLVGPIATALVGAVIISVLLILYSKESVWLAGTQGAITFFAVSILAFVYSFISFEPNSPASFGVILTVLLAVGVAVLNGWIEKELKLFLRALGVGIMVAAIATLVII